MECSTNLTTEQSQELDQALTAVQHYALVEKDWQKVQDHLGINLEQTAREAKAIQRVREIRNAADLLRLVLFYALSDWSLRLCGGWALLCGIGFLSDVAVLKRLRHCRVWLGQLLAQLMAQRCSALRQMPGVRLRILDATCLSHPGSTTTDWRIHLSFDLGHLCLDGISITDRHGGETLARFPSQPDEIQIADAGYAFASGMGPVLNAEAGLVVRINWRNVAVFSLDGQRLRLIPWLRGLTRASEQAVLFETPQGWQQLRLIAAPLPPEKAYSARRRVRERYQRKQKGVSADTLFAAGVVLLLTNLPAQPWTLSQVLFLYRVRWQIELLIKRLKGILHFDALRARQPSLAQTYLLAKLLSAMLVEQLIHQVELQQPDWFTALDRPLSLSRLMQWSFETLRQTIFGPWLLKDFALYLGVMRRYLCDSPRSRPQQLAWARAIFEHTIMSPPHPLS